MAREDPTYTSKVAQKAYEDGKKDGYIQRKIENIQKPLACRNAHCGAVCSMAMASGYMRIFKEPRKCPHYERDDIGYEHEVINKIRAEVEQLPTKTRTNWDGCCPDIDYPEIEYVDVTKKQLLDIIDKYKAESEAKR